MMTYQEECRLRAQMLLDAADGVVFQYMRCGGKWEDVSMPNFNSPLDQYRRKPKKVRHERVVVWHLCGKSVSPYLFSTNEQADASELNELKRETVFVEVEE